MTRFLPISAREAALRVAAETNAAFDAKAVMVVGNCSAIAAQTALSNLVAAGKLDRVARGFFARPGLFPKNTSTAAGPTTMARGLNEAANRALEAADKWLKECPPLPKCQPPAFDAPRSRHGGTR